MRLMNFLHNGVATLGHVIGDEVVNLTEIGGPTCTDDVVTGGAQAMAELATLSPRAKYRTPVFEIAEWLPPILAPGKAIAIGLNYIEHAREGSQDVPDYPVVFARYPSSWVGHKVPIIQPKLSKALDYEGELAVVIGKAGRYIERSMALCHVAGYSIFNEGSVRDYQMRSHQWTIGKNFDRSGSFGPHLVTADELPLGARGLRLETRLNGKTMQDANTNDMIFDVATLISLLSDVMQLNPGDVIISGTPAGIGAARTPPVFMQPGDICEVSIEGLGTLSNTIEAEALS